MNTIERDARILLAEDNLVNQRIITLQLNTLGYSVDIASNGLEALALLDRNPYDLLLTDIQMPVMDGCELSRRVRAQEGTASTRMPIIAITANAQPSDTAKFFAAGIDDVVHKPLVMNDMRSLLRQWLDQASPESDEIEPR